MKQAAEPLYVKWTPELLKPVPGRDHIQGRVDAPIQLLQYGDFACSHSGRAYYTVKTLQEHLGDRLCFTFRHFPMPATNPRARHAALAAEAAATQSKFWQMHHLLFKNQPALADDDLARYSRALGLNTPRLMREVFSGAHASRLDEDIKSAKENGVTHSPTFFVNGKRCDSVLAFHALMADAALCGITRNQKASPAFI